MKPVTFKGKQWRCQLSAMDYRDGDIPKWKDLPLKFAVCVLPASAPKSQSFGSYADPLYLGPSLNTALKIIQARIGRGPLPELPNSWKKRYADQINVNQIMMAAEELSWFDGRRA